MPLHPQKKRPTIGLPSLREYYKKRPSWLQTLTLTTAGLVGAMAMSSLMSCDKDTGRTSTDSDGNVRPMGTRLAGVAFRPVPDDKISGHVVAKGESLKSICMMYYGVADDAHINAVIAANPGVLDASRTVSPGISIMIPVNVIPANADPVKPEAVVPDKVNAPPTIPERPEIKAKGGMTAPEKPESVKRPEARLPGEMLAPVPPKPPVRPQENPNGKPIASTPLVRPDVPIEGDIAVPAPPVRPAVPLRGKIKSAAPTPPDTKTGNVKDAEGASVLVPAGAKQPDGEKTGVVKKTDKPLTVVRPEIVTAGIAPPPDKPDKPDTTSEEKTQTPATNRTWIVRERVDGKVVEHVFTNKADYDAFRLKQQRERDARNAAPDASKKPAPAVPSGDPVQEF